MREKDQRYIRPTLPVNRIDSSSEDEISYCNAETLKIIDGPSTSGNKNFNGVCQPLNQLVSGVVNESSDDVEVRPESPDLSRDCKKSKRCLNLSSYKLRDDTCSSDVNPVDSNNEALSSTSDVVMNHIKTESLSNLEVVKQNEQEWNGVKQEVFIRESDSEESSESISLLADFKVPVVGNV